MFCWGEANGVRASDHLFPRGSAWLEHKFLEVLGPTPWRRCRWHALCRGGSAACYARHPSGAIFPLVGETAKRRHGPAICDSVPRRCGRGPSSNASGGGHKGGGSGSSHTWRFGLPICSAQKLSPCPQLCSIPPPCWRLCLTPPPPLQNGSSRGGVSRHDKRLGHPSAPPPGLLHPPPQLPGDRGFVTIDSSDSFGSEGQGGGRLGAA